MTNKYAIISLTLFVNEIMKRQQKKGEIFDHSIPRPKIT